MTTESKLVVVVNVIFIFWLIFATIFLASNTKQAVHEVCVAGHMQAITGLTMSKIHDADGNHVPCENKRCN